MEAVDYGISGLLIDDESTDRLNPVWSEMADFQRAFIIRRERQKGKSWRDIAVIVGRTRKSYSTIYKWARRNLPELFNKEKTLHNSVSVQSTLDSILSLLQQSSQPISESSSEFLQEKMNTVISNLDHRTTFLEEVADQITSDMLEEQFQKVITPKNNHSNSIPPPPPNIQITTIQPAPVKTSHSSPATSQEWQNVSWNQLSREEIDNIPAHILDGFDPSIRNLISNRLEELDHLDQQTIKKSSQLSSQSTPKSTIHSEMQNHPLFLKRKKMTKTRVTISHTGWSRCDYWYCFKCKTRFSNHEDVNPDICPLCHLSQIVEWSPMIEQDSVPLSST